MTIWRIIWELSEFTGVGLGRFAPYVFDKMIGRKGKKIEQPSAQQVEICSHCQYYYHPDHWCQVEKRKVPAYLWYKGKPGWCPLQAQIDGV